MSIAALFGFPFATSLKPIPNLMADKVYNIQDSPILLGLTIIGALMALISIFLYKNRTLQLRLSNISIICSILLIFVTILMIYNERTITEHADTIEDGLGVYFPVLSIIFSILANRYIKKDENLVQSMDRLR
jgi:glucan phosphoethanolaminetransferase (alkaline phosphatase superfamily)